LWSDHPAFDRSVPIDYKVSFPSGRFRCINRVWYDNRDRPTHLGERLKAPAWWHQPEALAVFDKIMLDKASQPRQASRGRES
jgi:hypothetical protein